MADYNSDIIKPVESLPNIAGISPTRRREERRRRQDMNKEDKDKKHKTDGDPGNIVPENQSPKWPDNPNQTDSGRIDYCA